MRQVRVIKIFQLFFSSAFGIWPANRVFLSLFFFIFIFLTILVTSNKAKPKKRKTNKKSAERLKIIHCSKFTTDGVFSKIPLYWALNFTLVFNCTNNLSREIYLYDSSF